MDTLRLHIDGSWSARDLSLALQEIDQLADFVALNYVLRESNFTNNITPEGAVFEEYHFPSHFLIKKLQYSSPGICDLGGAGKIVEEVRVFMTYLIDLWVNRNDRALDRESKGLANVEKRLMLIRYMQDNGLERFIPAVEGGTCDTLMAVVAEGLITRVENPRIEIDLPDPSDTIPSP